MLGGDDMAEQARKTITAGLAAGAGLLLGLGAATYATPGALADLVERLGLPVALLVVLVVAIIAAGSWAARNVVEPLVQALLRFMERTGDLMQAQKEAIRDLQRIAEGARTDMQSHNEQERMLLAEIRAALVPTHHVAAEKKGPTAS